jgi:hypothetical protein
VELELIMFSLFPMKPIMTKGQKKEKGMLVLLFRDPEWSGLGR